MYPDTTLLDLPEAMPAARASADTAPANSPSESASEKFVAFRIADRLFVVKASSVSEVILPHPVTPIPRMPGFIVGITELSGNLLTVIDLAELVLGTEAGHSAYSRMIVLHPQPDASPLVFAVEKIAEMMWFDADLASPNRETSPPPHSAEYGGEMVWFIDSAWLTAELFKRVSESASSIGMP